MSIESTAREMLRSAGAAGFSQVWRLAVTFLTHMALRRLVPPEELGLWSWTEGLFFILQHATKATMEFIGTLTLDDKPAAVFCTYKTAAGKILPKMATAMKARGANVTGQFKSRGPGVPDGFAAWVDSLA